MIQAGKRKKEFADPYTVTGAVTKGNIITKLSLLIMGLGNIAHRQIAKGLMFLVVEIGYIWFMIQSGIYNLSMFPSLGWREQEKVWNEKVYEANNTVMVHIRRLRGKMKEDTRQNKIITTVWGVGYKIEK